MSIRLPAFVVTVMASVGCGDLIGIEDRRYPSSENEGPAATAAVGSTGSSSGTISGPGGGTGGNGAKGGSGGQGGNTGTGDNSGTSGTGGAGGDAAGAGGGGAAPCSDDLTSDPLNCGECGHDCLGGDCEIGICQPVRITDPLPIAEYRCLVVDADADGEIFFARWRPDAVVYRVGKEPGAVPEELHTLEDDGWAFDVAIDHEWVYFTNYSDTFSDGVRGVYAQRRTGGPPVQLVRGDDRTSGPAFIKVDGTDVFFTTYFGGTAVGKTGFGGGPVEPIWYIGDEPPYYQSPSHLALAADWVYVGTNADGVWRHQRSGRGSERVFETSQATEAFGVGMGFAYWKEYVAGGGATLRRAPLNGGEATLVAAEVQRDPVVYRGFIYYITANATELRRVPLGENDEPSELLASNPGGMGSIAVDEASVFWMTNGTGEIFRRAVWTGPPGGAPDVWTCQPAWYGDGDACDCGCGALDPDCDDASTTTYGCGAPHDLGDGASCTSQGTCTIPPSWQCAESQFADGTVCNCECGAPDPDCDVGRLLVAGCAGDDFYCHDDICIQTAPGAFCDSAHMGAADGCDCDCDAYDPDCDDPDQVIHGCGTQHAPGEGPACLGDGGCESPLAWTCATAAYDDFSSCDCSCGALDPDCIVDRELPVAGCGVDQRCPSDTCVDIAAGDTCETATDLVEGEISGDFSTIVDDYDPGGACGLYGTPGRDVSFRLTLAAGETATIVVDPSNWVDVAAYLVSSCDDVVAACVTGADENWLGDPETLSFTAVEATTLFLIVDQYGGPLDGTFTVTLDLDP